LSRKQQPTSEQRQIVERAVAMGLDQEQIAKLIGVAPKTLRRCYQDRR